MLTRGTKAACCVCLEFDAVKLEYVDARTETRVARRHGRSCQTQRRHAQAVKYKSCAKHARGTRTAVGSW